MNMRISFLHLHMPLPLGSTCDVIILNWHGEMHGNDTACCLQTM